MPTITVLIGNSDDKLPQRQWYNFVREMENCIRHFANEFHFSGGSDCKSLYQNYCFVFDMEPCEKMISKLKFSVKDIRKFYGQDSVALLSSDETEFI